MYPGLAESETLCPYIHAVLYTYVNCAVRNLMSEYVAFVLHSHVNLSPGFALSRASRRMMRSYDLTPRDTRLRVLGFPRARLRLSGFPLFVIRISLCDGCATS